MRNSHKKTRRKPLTGFTPLEVQKRLSLFKRFKAKPPKGSVFSITKRSRKPLTGFTIIEALLAIFILSVAVFGGFYLIQQTLVGVSLSQSRLVAFYFAQEGAENIRNIRDTNWLEGNDWKDGLLGSSEQVINFLDGSPSRFTRTITVTEETDYLQVVVIVEWSERGRSHSVETISRLYDWY